MQYIQIRPYTCNTCNTHNTLYTCRYIQIHTIHAIHAIHAILADTFRYILMLVIHAHTYIIHATYMLYIQIHTNIYTSLLHCDIAVILLCMYVYVLHVCNVIHTHTYTYMHIHIYSYIHIHTPHSQWHEGVLGCCCCCTRLLCAAPPTQICSDGAQDGISMQPLRVEGPWAAQGSCFSPPLRVQGALARKNWSGHGSLNAG